MLKSCVVLLAFTASSLSAQSRVDLMQRVADHFANANSFDVKGIASAPIPGSSWRATYEFESEGAQPSFLPLSVHGPSLQVTSNVRKFAESQLSTDATDPKPQRSFEMIPFGRFNDLTRRLIDAQKTGTETVTVEGRAHSCEIIDATYDTSPEFKPHSQTTKKRFAIDPSEMLVLRETGSSDDGMEWTAEVTSVSFDQPPSEALVQALKSFAAQAKDRPEWVGRPIPDLTLTQLSGPPVKLASLSGKTILLDFWGSYCHPCARTTVHAQGLADQYRSSGLAVLTFTQDKAQDAKLWADYYHVNLPVLLDPEGAAFKAFDVQGVPVTILIDKNGTVLHYWVGLSDPTIMDAVVSAALGGHPAQADVSEPSH
jgi:peroxiredoxin